MKTKKYMFKVVNRNINLLCISEISECNGDIADALLISTN